MELFDRVCGFEIVFYIIWDCEILEVFRVFEFFVELFKNVYI